MVTSKRSEAVTENDGILFQWYMKWSSYVNDVFMCIEHDNKLKPFRFLPSGGGYYDQDETTIEIWETIREIYINILSDPEIAEYMRAKNG